MAEHLFIVVHQASELWLAQLLLDLDLAANALRRAPETAVEHVERAADLFRVLPGSAGRAGPAALRLLRQVPTVPRHGQRRAVQPVRRAGTGAGLRPHAWPPGHRAGRRRRGRGHDAARGVPDGWPAAPRRGRDVRRGPRLSGLEGRAPGHRAADAGRPAGHRRHDRGADLAGRVRLPFPELHAARRAADETVPTR